MASASSSTRFFAVREGEQQQPPTPLQPQHQSSSAPPPSNQAVAPVKKKRNLPGTPYPDAEVIALSPKTLLATNRFICEVCNKGFQREQNLQLHRRGHNLPWKLKQKNPKEVVRRRVYLCPEPTCVHHDPSRPLGDLTGIKKHFCRKHGEKKWKCGKCSKRYAVQSDWKAHSKTCGTREYRCDCGTLFSRRDSFITHRAFCDALAQESARLPSGLTALGSHLYGNRNMSLGLSQVNSQLASLQDQNHPSVGLLPLGGTGGPQFDQIISPSNSSSFRSPQPQASSGYYLGHGPPNPEFGEESQPPPHHSLIQNNLFNLNFFSNGNMTTNIISNNSSSSNQNNHHLMVNADHFGNANGSMNQSALFSGNLMSDPMGRVTPLYNSSLTNEQILPQMSATALLQKAAQMGATSSAAANFRSGFGAGGDGYRSQTENDATAHIYDLMNSLANGGSGLFGGHEQVSNGGLSGAFGAGLCNMDEAKFSLSTAAGNLGGGSEGLTRDFLGVGSIMRSMTGGISPKDQHQHAMNSFEAEMKSASSSRSFAGGGMQYEYEKKTSR